MAERKRRKRDPWLPAFVASLVMASASLVGLAGVLVSVLQGSEVAAGQVVQGAPGGAVSRPLTYSGPLPAALGEAGLTPAAEGSSPDLSFEAGPGAEMLAGRLFVPVAAFGTGIDSLTRAQLDGLITGGVTRWEEVGGLGGKVRYATAGPPNDQPLVSSFAGGSLPSATFGTYEELRAAMTWDSGLLAFVPLAEVRVSVAAITIDGVDVVRGRGDAAAWPFTERLAVEALSELGRAHLAEIRAMLVVQAPKTTRVVATGDILQSRCSLTAIRATGDWAAALRGPVGEYLAEADLALGSLDGSIQDIGTPYGCVSTTNLTSPPDVLAALTLAGFDEVTVATNHVFDCGQQLCDNRAFLRTLELLAGVGIKAVGGGNNLEAALAPALFEVNGVKFGILAFDDIAAEDLEATDTEPGTAPLDDDYRDEKAAQPAEPAFYKPAEMLQLSRLEDRIRRLKQQVDVVIVQIQSGYEDTHLASPRSIKALRAAADAGADLVVGNQGHHVQSAEVRGESFIAYALGNFIFDQVWTVDHTEGYLLEANFLGKRLVNVRMVPYRIVKQYKPTFVEGEQRTKILRDVMTASAELPAPGPIGTRPVGSVR